MGVGSSVLGLVVAELREIDNQQPTSQMGPHRLTLNRAREGEAALKGSVTALAKDRRGTLFNRSANTRDNQLVSLQGDVQIAQLDAWNLKAQLPALA